MLDASGNLYQYDNYDEVAMETDSETGSPGEDSPLCCWLGLVYNGTRLPIGAAFLLRQRFF